MSVFDPVLGVLKAIPAITDKVYHAEALKNASAPFVFWIQEGESFEKALEGYTELGENRYEIHIVTKNLSSLDDISKAVWKAVTGLEGTTAGGYLYESIEISQISPVINEREINLYRKVYSLAINYQEE